MTKVLDSYYRYEIKAEAFRLMTGQMAPGKDAPSASYPESFEDRYELWEDWLDQNGECINMVLMAAESILFEDEEPHD